MTNFKFRAPQPQPEVLGKLLIVQQTLGVLASKEEQAAFLCRALGDIPGVEDVHFCFFGSFVPEPIKLAGDAVCGYCTNTSPSFEIRRCCAVTNGCKESIALRASSGLYGFLILGINSRSAFAPYAPYVANTANFLATLLEKRQTKQRLQQVLSDLEDQVAARTADLVEKNARLEAEIARREAAEAALHEAYEQLERRVEERTAALKSSEERLQSIITTAVDGIITTNSAGVIELFNGAAERLFGYKASEVIGQHVRILMPTMECGYDANPIEAFVGADQGDIACLRRDVAARHKNGSVFPAELTVSEMEIGGERKFTGIIRDISERKWAETALRESEARFRAMAETVPDILFTSDAYGRIEYVSPRFYELTGLTENSGGTDWVRAIHPDDCENVRVRWRKSVRTKEPFQAKFRLRAVDGGYQWFQVRARPIYDEGNCASKWFGTCSDIDELVRIQSALEEGDRRKNEFLAMLSHELRNPLAPICNAVQVLGLLDLPDPRLRWVKEMIERQVKHLVHLVDDLLDVSRFTRGKITLKQEAIELSEVIERAVEATEGIIKAQEHQLSISYPDEPVWLKGDSVRLVQILTNLLNNAAKYTPHGGRIDLTAVVDHGKVVVSVSDTGIGIPPELLPHIFDLFTQADRSLDRSQGGLGIGLTLVRKLVEMHGGSIEASSKGPGLGSEFVVRLPRMDITELRTQRGGAK
ncbi:sensor histidine kinase [Methylocaldum szegediense]|uniref:histidine kinase n=1 Tax=Methylocaldum szegediense TaxID=73780 RepID=A0ABN8X7I0_9GAMM|nr:PAS domain S-box protein [Methylocaldum szegediense]CAI8883878.1 Histidine kinase [Methylocaldum szegediense]